MDNIGGNCQVLVNKVRLLRPIGFNSSHASGGKKNVLGFFFFNERLDFFLSGRSIPAWIAGLAFISANLGAVEILGFAANGAQYGFASVHYYWIGAIPAMVFLGIVMMPFYYGSKIRSVPEYLRRRYNKPTHLVNAGSFAVSSVLIGGVNLR